MKFFTKVLIALCLSAPVLSLAIERRQNDPISVLAGALNRLISRVVVEIFYINNIITTLKTLNAPALVGNLEANLAIVISSLNSTANVIAGGGTTGCSISPTGVSTLVAGLQSTQTIVSSIQNTLTQISTSLSAANIAALAVSVLSLQTTINLLSSNIQTYITALLPCISTLGPASTDAVTTVVTSLVDTVQNLTTSLGADGALNNLVNILNL